MASPRIVQLRNAFGLDDSEELYGQFSCAHTRPRWGSQFLQVGFYSSSNNNCQPFSSHTATITPRLWRTHGMRTRSASGTAAANRRTCACSTPLVLLSSKRSEHVCVALSCACNCICIVLKRSFHVPLLLGLPTGPTVRVQQRRGLSCQPTGSDQGGAHPLQGEPVLRISSMAMTPGQH